MRFQILMFPAAIFLTSIVWVNCSTSFGQVLRPIDASSQQTTKLPTENLGNLQEKACDPPQKEAKPYELSSRFHLQTGTKTGYLIVKVELPKGSYIYSTTQSAPLRPSKIQVTQSNQFRIIGKFTPDRPPTVIENDPVFSQRVEKHKDVIQFFATIEIAPGVFPETLEAETEFSGQVCNDQGFCVPIFGAKARGKFAGYFERTAKKRAGSQTVSPIRKQPR